MTDSPNKTANNRGTNSDPPTPKSGCCFVKKGIVWWAAKEKIKHKFTTPDCIPVPGMEIHLAGREEHSIIRPESLDQNDYGGLNARLGSYL